MSKPLGLNRVITNLYYCAKGIEVVGNYDWITHPDGFKLISVSPMSEFYVGTLVKHSARQIIVPYDEPSFAEPVDKEVDKLPEPFRKRIWVVDKGYGLRKDVNRYLNPIREEITTMESPSFVETSHFLYMLGLGARYQAEVDIFVLCLMLTIYLFL